MSSWLCKLMGHKWSYGEWYRRVGEQITWTRERSCWRCHHFEETTTYCRSKPQKRW